MPGSRKENKTRWIEYALAHYLAGELKGKIPDSQLEFCQEPFDIFRLFVIWSRAKRNIEGYGFRKDGYAHGPLAFIRKHYGEDEDDYEGEILKQ